MSDALKKVVYTIPKHCGICAHVNHIGEAKVMEGKCDWLLGAVVHLAGSCPNFTEEEKLVDFYVGDLRKFLDKRRYTRSNRHKAKTSY